MQRDLHIQQAKEFVLGGMGVTVGVIAFRLVLDRIDEAQESGTPAKRSKFWSCS